MRFSIFMAIRTAVHPGEAPALLHYAHLIYLVAKTTPGPLWLYYDREFHICHHFDQRLTWDSVHPQLFLSSSAALFSYSAL